MKGSQTFYEYGTSLRVVAQKSALKFMCHLNVNIQHFSRWSYWKDCVYKLFILEKFKEKQK